MELMGRSGQNLTQNGRRRGATIFNANKLIAQSDKFVFHVQR